MGCGASRECTEPNSRPGRGSPRWNRMRAEAMGTRLPAAAFPVPHRAGAQQTPSLGAEDDPEKENPARSRVRAGAALAPELPPAAHTGSGESRKTPLLKPAGLLIQVLPAVPSAPPAPSRGLPAASARRFPADFMAITQKCSLLSFSPAAPS